MGQNEYYYRRVIGAIGFSLLMFQLLINLFGVLITFATPILSMLSASEVTFNVLYQVFYAAGYLLCFMLPVAFLKSRIGKEGLPYRPMSAPLRISPWLILIVPAGITLVFSASYVNASFVSIFDYSDFSSEVLWGANGEKPAVYELVLDFLVTCLVPGFCEEFFFRGAILSNLRPFGRSNAILISAFLFGMMHQNPEQILYAFAAGVVLGVVYEMTGSIWNCTVLHVLNNFASVTEGPVVYKFDTLFASSLAMAVFEAVLFAVGLIALAILIARFFSRKPDLHEGVFGKSLPASDGYADYPISANRAFRLFLTPSMVIFLVICVVQILLLLLVAVLYGSFM